jgi:hypothetical protein
MRVIFEIECWEDGLRAMLAYFFHQIKVCQPIGRTISFANRPPQEIRVCVKRLKL